MVVMVYGLASKGENLKLKDLSPFLNDEYSRLIVASLLSEPLLKVDYFLND